jgi:hypothetical protein
MSTNDAIYVHVFLDGNQVGRRRMLQCPRHGDTVRLGGADNEKYAKVTEVIWCLDEESPMGQRVNLRLESEP